MKIDSQKIKKNSVALALSLCAIGVLSGCSALQSGSNEVKAMAVEPAPNAGFIEQPDRDKKIAYHTLSESLDQTRFRQEPL